ncbi:hypothetical protein HPP92_008060 [Vanilla planifolia]|uniref:Polysaccharide biosynthesis domain-containing protein n=1 Tax=Vanilla planifolia TaxID=51239 RepID=A0A835V6H0_VANPL|nr:hypothetical protein HPP92_008060 [Vanilla planifolia]
MTSKKKLLFFLFVLSSTIYVFKLTVTTRAPSYRLPRGRACIFRSSNFLPHESGHHATRSDENPLTPKELRLVSRVIRSKPNGNLLFFGINPQLLALAEADGVRTAIFLEDDPERIRRFRPQRHRGTTVHRVSYREEAHRAYELLRHGREDAGCRRRVLGRDASSRCRLRLNDLPREVYDKSWDVVVVDGPRGDRPEAPGRMAAIYTAAAMAWTRNETDVLVHDVDRTIEKWFSWEFLCHENLVSAKGKLWHFRLRGGSQSHSFCTAKTFQIL